MSTSNIPIKLRIDPELLAAFKKLHPSYGEQSRVMRELLAAYIQKQQKDKK